MTAYKWSPELESAMANANYAVGRTRYNRQDKKLFVLGPTTDKGQFMSAFVEAKYYLGNDSGKIQINGKSVTGACNFCRKVLACRYSKRRCDVRFEDITLASD